jgi:hypothetical protein
MTNICKFVGGQTKAGDLHTLTYPLTQITFIKVGVFVDTDLRVSIREFLRTALEPVLGRQDCPLCGGPLTHVPTTFWLYGETNTYDFLLPRCLSCENQHPIEGNQYDERNSEIVAGERVERAL